MEAAGKGQTLPGLVDIALRSQKERMWVKQDGTDRITVIFSIEFSAHNDAVLGQVFCQVCFFILFILVQDSVKSSFSSIYCLLF